METIHRNLIVLAITLVLLATYACSDDKSTGVDDPDSVNVTGIVVVVEDNVPVDGGVTIDLECLDGQSERLLFPSLFTNPPPSEDMQQLYQVILLLEIGNLVQAGGKRTEDGIELEQLTILQK